MRCEREEGRKAEREAEKAGEKEMFEREQDRRTGSKRWEVTSRASCKREFQEGGIHVRREFQERIPRESSKRERQGVPGAK